MKNKFFFIFLSLLLVIIPNTSCSNDSPNLWDLRLLDLKINKTEIADEIKGMGSSVKAKGDYKIVVITLKGGIKSKYTIACDPKGFEAVSISQEQNKNEKNAKIYRSFALAYSGIWIIDEPSASFSMATFNISPSDQIEIKIAFIVEKKHDNFIVRIPIPIIGEAVLK